MAIDEAGEQSRIFGEVADLYDAARPGYPSELFDTVLDYAKSAEHSTALEIGAGTGKATVPLAARGVPLVCVEPDPRMAEVLRRNTARHPGVTVEVGGFEEWQPGERRFGLLFAATCWHWIDPTRRWELAHQVLEPGGSVALCWNPQGVLDPELHARLTELNRRHGVSGPMFDLAADYHEAPGTDGADRAYDHWPEAECRRDGRFTDLRSLRFREPVRYDSESYVRLLASISAYRVLPADARARALDAVATLLDAHGGGIDLIQFSDLFLARRR
ncbi:SAM-dependent methyltransferase [Kitasatospora sp. GP30]|uniref:class I SAM-dependent methyltransferase n=1 Tax=Kitasatospora sp. GP30 TaxID=3035084 RepID=UPI000C70BFBE|nr:class I SAM-dependent methyltransferase [Kitasatospora sp. GP30]MDH6143659.1 SAM-dependent methyltransferase [Kitasatospora sp. GP30]